MGNIKLNHMIFTCTHGAHEYEYKIAQKFEVYVCLSTQGVYEAGVDDDITKTVPYDEAYKLISDIMHGEHVQLLESLCHRIGHQLLEKYDIVDKVKVEVTKMAPPIEHFNGTASVQMKFKRK